MSQPALRAVVAELREKAMDDPSLPQNEFDDQQFCSKCGGYFPLDDAYWHRDARAENGFRNTCRNCRRIEGEIQKSREIERTVRKLDEATLNAIDLLSRSSSNHVSDLESIFSELISAYGGAKGWARHNVANYLSAQPGSTTRQKHLHMVQKMAESLDSSDRLKADLSKLSTSDLEREFRRRVKVVDTNGNAIGHQKKLVDQRELDAPNGVGNDSLVGFINPFDIPDSVMAQDKENQNA